MVGGLRMTEGVLLFGKESLLLCEGFTLSPTGDVCCRKHHPSRYTCTRKGGFSLVSVIHLCLFGPPASVRDSFISTMLTKEQLSGRCRRWLYEDIKEARFMRFLLEVIEQIPTTIHIYKQVILYCAKAPVLLPIRTTPSRYS